ncbi:MAG TPA: sugar ABC transporter ATP-binding protein [Geminicoccus sp.]|uniref:sugar ABC transporter ATP-binding protein n=1 Tax=Geminicoccus sp. TaxID=2024832 RepID=UPI002E342754|nr:sugar ABC transporter ATP-binding protein [Geminicoccus sp.]HEX2526002.1 sugar ABC transporter ATP-binding protein [Geminicoccus sp.]
MLGNGQGRAIVPPHVREEIVGLDGVENLPKGPDKIGRGNDPTIRTQEDGQPCRRMGGLMEADAPLLRLEGIVKSFPGVRALRGVSFDVRPGEVHALLGENGAGKSTLIKVMSGVHQQDEGTLYVDGKPVRFTSPQEAQAAGIAAIYQELLLFPELTVAENVFMGHAPRLSWGGVDWATMRARTAEILHSLDIHDLDLDAPVGALSVGNRQRVEIAKALSMNARVLIMDEPTAALTEADVERLFGIVRRLRARGVGIIYISHRLVEIFDLADRVTVLRDGEYVATREVKDVTEPLLISMMVGRTIDQLYPHREPKPPGATLLEARSVAFPGTVEEASLTLRAGEIVGLAGLVGSGRSEFAQILFGITPASAGQILVDGKPVTIRSPSDAKRHGIAYVPEDRGIQGLIRPMRIRHNVSLAILDEISRFFFIDRNREQDLAKRDIARFSIRASSMDQVVGKLSGGNQQKVVLAKWLATKPRILILDEPTRGIDVGAKAEIHRIMSELAGQGLAILMISSELPEVLGMSDRVLVMREGRIVAGFDRAEATQEVIAGAMMRVVPAGMAA